MHPFHTHFHHGFRGGMGWHRGPSRLLWFAIGAAVSAWWIKRKDSDKRIFGHCMRPALPLPVPPSPVAEDGRPQQGHPAQVWHWPQNMSEIPQAVNNIPAASSAPYPPTPGAWTQDAPWKWDQEREHFAKISRQAADAMTDLTESTLEGVLTTAEALKVKLAEHKAQREKHQKLIDQQFEEQRKSPPRFV